MHSLKNGESDSPELGEALVNIEPRFWTCIHDFSIH
jgi:hypothetical protein